MKMLDFETISPPRQKDSTYLMADYVELLCVVNTDHEISIDEVIKRVYHSVELETERETEINEGAIVEESPCEFKDNQLKAGVDWMRQLSYREATFNEHYPFHVDGNKLLLKTDLVPQQKTYIYLLICSCLRVIKRTFWLRLTSNFELISSKALEAYLPGFTVHLFGKSTCGRPRYSTKLVEAIAQLSDDLRERNICRTEIIGDKNTGDGGLDVVAWRRAFNDENAPGSVICFAQCACSPEDWKNKQHESHNVRWRHKIDFMHPPVNLMFIPICFRDSTGQWYNENEIEDCILLDRLRICNLFDNTTIGEIDFDEVVNACIGQSNVDL